MRFYDPSVTCTSKQPGGVPSAAGRTIPNRPTQSPATGFLAEARRGNLFGVGVR